MDNDFFILCDDLIEYHGREEIAVIPESVVRICPNAFFGCTTLKKIIIPDSVIKIKHSAFANCTNLESLNIPESVTEIGNGVFWGCDSLKSLATKYGAFPLVHYNCWKLLPDVFSLFSAENADEIESCFSRTIEKLVLYSAQEIIAVILQSEKFACLLTPELTDKLIQRAIEMKHYAIQLMLTDYKYQHFEFKQKDLYL